jgi:hypothetical protein
LTCPFWSPAYCSRPFPCASGARLQVRCPLWITQLLLLIRTTSPVTGRTVAIAVFCGAGEDERPRILPGGFETGEVAAPERFGFSWLDRTVGPTIAIAKRA